MVVQPGLCQTRLETPKTGFLVTRLNYILSRSGPTIRCQYQTHRGAVCPGSKLFAFPTALLWELFISSCSSDNCNVILGASFSCLFVFFSLPFLVVVVGVVVCLLLGGILEKLMLIIMLFDFAFK